jgi:LuxR family transcriptional regulator, maltose regulon positive regulatory protein
MPRTRRPNRQEARCPHCGAPLPVTGQVHLDDALSAAQLRVLALLNRGCTTREMAQELDIAVGTVRWHLSQIFDRLRVRSRTQAVVKARELRLL